MATAAAMPGLATSSKASCRPAEGFERMHREFDRRRQAQFRELTENMAKVDSDLFMQTPARGNSGSFAPEIKLLGALPPTTDCREGERAGKKAAAYIMRGERQAALDLIAKQRGLRSARSARTTQRDSGSPLASADASAPRPPQSARKPGEAAEESDALPLSLPLEGDEVKLVDFDVAEPDQPPVDGDMEPESPSLSVLRVRTPDVDSGNMNGSQRNTWRSSSMALAWEADLSSFYEQADAERNQALAERSLAMQAEHQASNVRKTQKRRFEARHMKRETALALQFRRTEVQASHARECAETGRKLSRGHCAAQAAADQVRISTARRRSEKAARQQAVAASRLFMEDHCSLEKTARAIDRYSDKTSRLAAACEQVDSAREKTGEPARAQAARNAYLGALRSARSAREHERHDALVQLAAERQQQEEELTRRRVAELKDKRQHGSAERMLERAHRNIANWPVALCPTKQAAADEETPARAADEGSGDASKEESDSILIFSDSVGFGALNSELLSELTRPEQKAFWEDSLQQFSIARGSAQHPQVPVPALPAALKQRPYGSRLLRRQHGSKDDHQL